MHLPTEPMPLVNRPKVSDAQNPASLQGNPQIGGDAIINESDSARHAAMICDSATTFTVLQIRQDSLAGEAEARLVT